MKNKTKLLLTTLLIVTIFLIPNINAKTTKINNENDIKNQHASTIEADEESECIGLIHGSVGNSHGVYTWTTYPFALVTTGIKRTRCNIFGDYSMSLLLYREYYVTAHVKGFKPLTKHVYLTLEKPIQQITFDMDESEPENVKSIENPKPTFYGLIFGRTGGVFEHASWSVGFTKLSFENRSKLSGYFGFYIIGKLEIGKTYSITASKEDYSDLTTEVTLAAEKPIQRINFFMYPDY